MNFLFLYWYEKHLSQINFLVAEGIWSALIIADVFLLAGICQ